MIECYDQELGGNKNQEEIEVRQPQTPILAMGRRILQDRLILGVKIIASAVQPKQYSGRHSPQILSDVEILDLRRVS